jgi:hypothetical protein
MGKLDHGYYGCPGFGTFGEYFAELCGLTPNIRRERNRQQPLFFKEDRTNATHR